MEQKNVVNKTKTRSFKSVYKSGMLYGAEPWTLGRHQADKLLTKEMEFWLRAARKKRTKLGP